MSMKGFSRKEIRGFVDMDRFFDCKAKDLASAASSIASSTSRSARTDSVV
jgi:hypothetical protein